MPFDEAKLRSSMAFLDLSLGEAQDQFGIVEKIAQICSKYNLTEKKFVNEWFAFSLNNQNIPLTHSNLLLFDGHNQNISMKTNSSNFQTAHENKENSPGVKNSVYIPKSPDYGFESPNESILSIYDTPESQTHKSLLSAQILTPKHYLKSQKDLQKLFSPQNASKYGQVGSENDFKNSENIVVEENSFLSSEKASFWAQFNDIVCSQSQRKDFNVPKFLPPFDKASLSDFALYCNSSEDSLLDYVHKRIQALASFFPKVSKNDLKHFSEASNEPRCFSGMIVPSEDSFSSEKLTENNCSFANFSEEENLQISKLNISNLESYFLYPGKVCMVRGSKNLEDIIHVEEIFDPEIIKEEENCSQSTATAIFAACGPFNSLENLQNNFFSKLFDAILQSKCKICLL
ncbi:MAG: DNA polymerase alpha subunit B, partial [Paramarteilia canceri]